MALSLEGAAGWTTPTPVAQTSTDSTAPAMAIDSEGGIHVVWSEFLPSNPEIFYSRWNGSSWSVPVNLSHDAGQSRFPDITVDRNGTLYVVWEEFTTGDAYFSYRDSSLNGPLRSMSPAATEAGSRRLVWITQGASTLPPAAGTL